MLNGERKYQQIEESRSASGKSKSVTELLNNYKPELVEGGFQTKARSVSTSSI